jgi:hypothetical protein
MKLISFFRTDYQLSNANLEPTIKRKSKTQALLNSLTSPISWDASNTWNEFATGSRSPYYDSLTPYFIGDKVIDDNNAVYECFSDLIVGMQPMTTNNPLIWQMVAADFRGVLERLKYTGEKLQLEYILNRWFRTTWVQPDSQNMPMTVRPDIYIDNNELNNNVFTVFDNAQLSSVSYAYDIYSQAFVVDDYSFSSDAFTIWVPAAFYASLGTFAEQKIRTIADLYVIAGIKYNIYTY